MERAEPSQEKTELVKEKKLEDLPVEVLAKIFNYLHNHDICGGVSLACKKFLKICRNESLVPVKDLCIKGHFYFLETQESPLYGLRNIGAVFITICKAKNLTTLKIIGLNYESINSLVSTALQACPKLIHLEIVETFAQSIAVDPGRGLEAKGKDFWPIFALCESILKFGQNLEIINLLLHGGEKGWDLNWMLEDYISIGCPKLKSFALESLDLSGNFNQFISIEVPSGLRSLQHCKELKNLKFKKIRLLFSDDMNNITYTENYLRNMFPNCNLEIKNCVKSEYFHGHSFHEPFDGSNHDVLDDFEGEEIKLMFTQNYGY